MQLVCIFFLNIVAVITADDYVVMMIMTIRKEHYADDDNVNADGIAAHFVFSNVDLVCLLHKWWMWRVDMT